MSGDGGGISRIRLVLGVAGGLLATFGGLRLLTEIPLTNLLALAAWLGGAVVLHDALLSPGVAGLGRVLRRIPDRARTYVQSALIAAVPVTVIAIPMIHRAGSQPQVKAILDQDFRANLALLLAVISAGAVLAYLRRVRRDRSTADRPVATSGQPPSEDVPTVE